MEWTGPTNGGGYGAIGIGRITIGAHVLAFMLAGNYVPPGMCVCHTCDNPPCCNPYHLFLGRDEDNVADRVSKRRTAKGEDAGCVKLTAEDVRSIRALDLPQVEIARIYGVLQSNISRIVNRKTWRHIQ